jgi:cytoskeletal protein CcmA (bactofilin family)
MWGGKEADKGSRKDVGEAAASASSGGLSAFIDQGSSFEGKLSFRDTVRIDGRFVGEISSENTLIVGEPAELEARVTSGSVIIAGTVSGDIIARRKVVLQKTARVEGTIDTPALVMEEGACLVGQVKMAKPAKPAAPVKPPVEPK